MFKIGDFSKLTRVSVRMLRYYDELGLLKPAEVDKFTGYRYYSAMQISRLNKIVGLRDMGFLAAEIAEILNGSGTGESLLMRLENKKKDILEIIASENGKIQKIENMIKLMEKECGSMNYEVTVKCVPAYKVVSLREIIPAYNMEGILWEKLAKFAERNNINCSSYSFAIYHDKEYKESNVDVEVAICVDDLSDDREGFRYRVTEEVPFMASMMISGPFENIAPGYNSLAEWVENNNYEIAGKSRQICHNGPWNEISPENYLTEIQIPVVLKK